MAESAAIEDIRDEDGLLQPEFVARIRAAVAASDGAAARRLTDDLHEADLADLIMALNSDERIRLIELLGRDFDVEALPQLDEAVRDELMEALPNPVIASAVGQLDTDDAAYLIEDMDEADQREILAGTRTFEQLARANSEDASAPQGGDLGWAAPGAFVPEFEEAIYRDLAWLGLAWEEPVRRQSQHLPAYADALARLAARGLIYAAGSSGFWVLEVEPQVKARLGL